MAVLNVTPDSFADGGLYDDPARAVDAALAMEAAGADIDDLRIARRDAEFGRIDANDRRCCVRCHGGNPCCCHRRA